MPLPSYRQSELLFYQMPKKKKTKTAVNHTVKGPISDLPVRRTSGRLLQDTLHAGASTAKLQTETVLGE